MWAGFRPLSWASISTRVGSTVGWVNRRGCWRAAELELSPGCRKGPTSKWCHPGNDCGLAYKHNQLRGQVWGLMWGNYRCQYSTLSKLSFSSKSDSSDLRLLKDFFIFFLAICLYWWEARKCRSVWALLSGWMCVGWQFLVGIIRGCQF